MDQSPDKSAKRSMWIITAASMMVVLALAAGLGFRIDSAFDDFIAANSDRHFANSSQREYAVVSLEKQSRIRSKAPRRQVQFGALPPKSTPDMPAVAGERLAAKARSQTLTTRSLPNDRAPPALTA